MKKIIYAILFTFVVAMSFTSCTEEEVAPSTDLSENGGGGASDKP